MKTFMHHDSLSLIHTLPILAIFVFAGCSGGPPGESVGRKALENQVQSQSNGKIRVVNFTKMNGKGDDTYYQLEYEAEIEFLSNGAWESRGGLTPAVTFGFSTEQVANNALSQTFGNVVGARNVRKGQREKVSSVLRFEKTEKGWRGLDGHIY